MLGDADAGCVVHVPVAHTCMSVDALAEPALAGFLVGLPFAAALDLPFFLGLASGSSSSRDSSRMSSLSCPASKAARFSSPSKSSTGTSAQHGALGWRSLCASLAGGCRPSQEPPPMSEIQLWVGSVGNLAQQRRNGACATPAGGGPGPARQEGEERGSGAGTQAAWRLTIKQV